MHPRLLMPQVLHPRRAGDGRRHPLQLLLVRWSFTPGASGPAGRPSTRLFGGNDRSSSSTASHVLGCCLLPRLRVRIGERILRVAEVAPTLVVDGLTDIGATVDLASFGALQRQAVEHRAKLVGGEPTIGHDPAEYLLGPDLQPLIALAHEREDRPGVVGRNQRGALPITYFLKV